MVLRIRSADSQHKRGLTLLFFPPTCNWLLSNFPPFGSTACGSVNTSIQFMPRVFLCQPAGSSLSLPWRLSAYALGQVRTHASLPLKCHEYVPLQTLGLFGQKLKQTAVTMPGSGSPEIFLSFFFFFHIPPPILILTVCKQIQFP